MTFRSILVTGIALSIAAAPALQAQSRGRKYKTPPPTSHVAVTVLKGYNGKPIANAAVIFHPVLNGHDEGNLEVKTNEEGTAAIDVIPTGANVELQVIADGFATYAGAYVVAEADRAITVKMLRPQAQISAYEDNHGRAAERPAGVQEPGRPGTTAPVIQPPKPTSSTSDPTAPAPVSPNTTPGNSQNGTPGNPSGVPPTL